VGTSTVKRKMGMEIHAILGSKFELSTEGEAPKSQAFQRSKFEWKANY
jgi:hypothetical protein